VLWAGAQFLRLGRLGYTKIMRNCHAVAMYLGGALEATGYFQVIATSCFPIH